MKTNFEKLGAFTNAVGAARMLLRRSHEQGFLIEGLVLYATLIDGFCRIALVLKEQIKNRSDDFDVRYIHQDDKKNYYSERSIYKQALEKGIVDEKLFDEINALYDIRNKAVHQFLINEIEYAHLGLLLDRYELMYRRLFNVVYELESQQILKSVGMTISRKTTEDDRKRVFDEILNKIETKDSDKLQRVLSQELIPKSKLFSEKNEREKISEEISEEIEISEEKAKIPPGYASVKEITTWARKKKLFDQCACGHEKIYHIDHKEMKSKKIEDYAKKCGVSGCVCNAYVNASLRTLAG